MVLLSHGYGIIHWYGSGRLCALVYSLLKRGGGGRGGRYLSWRSWIDLRFVVLCAPCTYLYIGVL